MGVKLGLSLQREEHRLRVFENRALGRIFGPEREEVAGGQRRLHKEGDMGGGCTTRGGHEKCILIFIRKNEGKGKVKGKVKKNGKVHA
jgi:hypothetical protein